MATENARAIEAILMVADQPVQPQLLAQLLELKVDEVKAVLDELMASYEVEDRGFILTEIAGGYRYQSHPDLAPYVERFVLEGQSARLSAAALETLAIIAYKQPISRAQVAQVRGVNVDGVVKTLEQRGYIAEIGRDPGPGNPSLFGTTDAFLEKLGLASLADLPPIAGFVPGPDVVEQLEQGLRAEIDAETAAYVADLAERADEAAAEESGEEPGGEDGGDGSGGEPEIVESVEVDVVAATIIEVDGELHEVDVVEVIDVVEVDGEVAEIDVIDLVEVDGEVVEVDVVEVEVLGIDDGIEVVDDDIEVVDADADGGDEVDAVLGEADDDDATDVVEVDDVAVIEGEPDEIGLAGDAVDAPDGADDDTTEPDPPVS